MPFPATAQPPREASSFYWIATVFFAVLVLGLTTFGIGMLAEAGSKTGTDVEKLMRFHDRQLYWWFSAALIFGIIACLVPLDLHKHYGNFNWGKYLRGGIWLYYGATSLLLALILVPKIGTRIAGSTRWLTLPFGDTRLQISDFAKVSFVLLFALVLADACRHLQPGGEHWRKTTTPTDEPENGANAEPKKGGSIAWLPFRRDRRKSRFVPSTPGWRGFLSAFAFPCLIVTVPVALIALETDVGTLGIFGIVAAILLLVNGAKLRFLVPIFLLMFLAALALIASSTSRVKRIIGFIDPERLSDDVSYQLFQGMKGFAAGGVDGVGMGNTIMQRGYVAEAHTDFVFSIIGEGMGFVGTAAVASCYLAMFLCVMLCLRRAHNPFQFNVCLGAMLFLVIQGLVNMCVVTGCAPTTGVALPFISYGGSSLVNSFLLAGLVLNCLFRWRKPPQENTDTSLS